MRLSGDKLGTTLRKSHKYFTNCILIILDIGYRESIHKQTQVGTGVEEELGSKNMNEALKEMDCLRSCSVSI